MSDEEKLRGALLDVREALTKENRSDGDRVANALVILELAEGLGLIPAEASDAG